MKLKEIDTSKVDDQKLFIDFPFTLYATCKQWVPPLTNELYAALNRTTFPFYQYGDAAFYAVMEDREVLGRIGIFNNRRYNTYRGAKTAFFYFFESVNDFEVSRMLFQAAFNWAHGQGLTQILGPYGMLSQVEAGGHLVEGFEHRPALGIPYNYSYYDILLQDAGLNKLTDYLSGYFTRQHNFPTRILDLAERAKQRTGLTVKSFKNKQEIWRWAPHIQNIYNTSFQARPNFHPVTDEEVKIIARRLISIAHPKTCKLLMRSNEVVGFLFAYPDVTRAIQKARGRLWPWGWLLIALEVKRTEWCNINSVALAPEYQSVGGNAILYAEIAETLRSNDFRFKYVDIVLVDEGNERMVGDLNKLGINWYKRHRSYQKIL